MSDITLRVTSPNILTLGSKQVFVFGSNESGIHGAGAALIAKELFGAQQGKGFGPQGRSFAIPTKDWQISTLPPLPIAAYVDRFLQYAILNPKTIFLVTEIGCGYAGYTPIDIAPMFVKAHHIKNIHLPEKFWDIIIK
jgi:hypothetical protein